MRLSRRAVGILSAMVAVLLLVVVVTLIEYRTKFPDAPVAPTVVATETAVPDDGGGPGVDQIPPTAQPPKPPPTTRKAPAPTRTKDPAPDYSSSGY